MRISRKVKIKENVYRQVHITPSNGSATWIAYIGGKAVSVTGIVEGNLFIADPIRKHIVEAYMPQRNSYKADGDIKQNVTAADLRKRHNEGRDRWVQFEDDWHQITYTSKNNGFINSKGNRISGTVSGRNFVEFG